MDKEFYFAILDDEEIARSAISSLITSIMKKYNAISYCSSFSNASDFFKGIKEKAYDAIVLDIMMPDCNGIEVAKKIREYDEDIKIIFVSSEKEKVFDSFITHPFGFIRKSNFSSDIESVLSLFIASQSKNNDEGIVIQYKGVISKLQSKDITYVESFKNYQEIHSSKFSDVAVVRGSMQELETKFVEKGFVRAHKCYLVNCAFIKRLEKECVILSDNTIIPLSRRKLEEVKEKFFEYLRKKTDSIIIK